MRIPENADANGVQDRLPITAEQAEVDVLPSGAVEITAPDDAGRPTTVYVDAEVLVQALEVEE